MHYVVLDTNCLVMSIPSRSYYHRILTDFIEGKYTLCISNEIIEEYDEVLTQKMGQVVASNIINAILSSNNIKQVNPFFQYDLIQADADDNKFVNCALLSNASFIVTQDRHFDVLRNIEFPKVEVIDIDSFLYLLASQNRTRMDK